MIKLEIESMEPRILIWISYLVLGYFVLDAIIRSLGGFLGNFQYVINGFQYIVADKYTVEDGFQQVGDNDGSFLVLPVISASVAIVTIIGLARRIAWVRIIAPIIIVTETITVIAFSIHVYFMIDIKELADSLRSSLLTSIPIVYIPLLFLAYKLYTSEPLKVYLSKPPHAAP